MSEAFVLIVDGDPKSLRVMEVSLRKEGFPVMALPDGKRALEWVAPVVPACLVVATDIDGLPALDVVRRLRSRPGWHDMPVLLLSRHGEDALVREAMDLGVQEFLTRPVFVRELVARIRMVLERRAHSTLVRGHESARSGDLAGLAILDVLTTLEAEMATGVVYADHTGHRGRIYLREGRIIDARVGALEGREALFRVLRWDEGTYTIDLRELHRKDRIGTATDELVGEALERVSEWQRLMEQLPDADPVLEVDYRHLAERLGDLPDDVNYILRLFDGIRTVSRVVDDSPFDDLETLRTIFHLIEEDLLRHGDDDVHHDEGRALSGHLKNWLETKDTAVQAAAEAVAPRTGLPEALPGVGDLAVDPEWRAQSSVLDQLRAERELLQKEREELLAERERLAMEVELRETESLRREIEAARGSASLPPEELVTTREWSPDDDDDQPTGIYQLPLESEAEQAEARSDDGPDPRSDEEAASAKRIAALEDEARSRTEALLRQAEEAKLAADQERRQAEDARRRAEEEIRIQRLQAEAEQRAKEILEEAAESRRLAEAARVEMEALKAQAALEEVPKLPPTPVEPVYEASSAPAEREPEPEPESEPAPEPTPPAVVDVVEVAPPASPPAPVDMAGEGTGDAMPGPASGPGPPSPVDLVEADTQDAVPMPVEPAPPAEPELAADEEEDDEDRQPTMAALPELPNVAYEEPSSDAVFAEVPTQRRVQGLAIDSFSLKLDEAGPAEEPEPEGELEEDFFSGEMPVPEPEQAFYFEEEVQQTSHMLPVLAVMLTLLSIGCGVFLWQYLKAKKPPAPLTLSRQVAPVPPSISADQLDLAALIARRVTPEEQDAMKDAAAQIEEIAKAEEQARVPGATEILGAGPASAAGLLPEPKIVGGDKASAAKSARPAAAAAAGKVKIPKLPGVKTFGVHFRKAEGMRKRGDFKGAIREYSLALAAKPRDPRALVALGNTYYELNRVSDARKAMQQAVRVAPSFADAFLGLGMVLQTQGKKGDALKAYDRFLALAPKHKFAKEVRRVVDHMNK